ncbi:hypothetical protein VOLCADRAFT_93165 [Volvox carteri f. nagariensis]|uniref:non-specific serine/threonine protein kinase n=1 Tax=Volvox carteri f. nagariensis TaxID=3068 RepID=D8U1G5_VOLCA|nr:uncharacterized protein VOLCADRAFT_93165 [Volvox carteri f. nagariensis]EFJ46335.1 hypothetical protein VOLCADRAFT_93165 [Volvox carteri f. nagariensis]|eukprot:XP_002952488.1 hypothetical protein VOLCADRAFT_93165 [Volvox carteri f. nagariensis]
MLTDRTNHNKPFVLKTFQRRAKEPSAPDRGAAVLSDVCGKDELSGNTTETAHTALGFKSTRYVLPGGHELKSGNVPAAVCPGGLLKSLRDRRTSVVLPFAMVLDAMHHKKESAGSRREHERLLAMRAHFAELVVRYAEIDAFELAVEDPVPSPQPERRRSHQYHKSQRSNGPQRMPAKRAIRLLLLLPPLVSTQQLESRPTSFPGPSPAGLHPLGLPPDPHGQDEVVDVLARSLRRLGVIRASGGGGGGHEPASRTASCGSHPAAPSGAAGDVGHGGWLSQEAAEEEENGEERMLVPPGQCSAQSGARSPPPAAAAVQRSRTSSCSMAVLAEAEAGAVSVVLSHRGGRSSLSPVVSPPGERGPCSDVVTDIVCMSVSAMSLTALTPDEGAAARHGRVSHAHRMTSSLSPELCGDEGASCVGEERLEVLMASPGMEDGRIGAAEEEAAKEAEAAAAEEEEEDGQSEEQVDQLQELEELRPGEEPEEEVEEEEEEAECTPGGEEQLEELDVEELHVIRADPHPPEPSSPISSGRSSSSRDRDMGNGAAGEGRTSSPAEAEAEEAEAAAAVRRSSTAPGPSLTPLQRLLQLCGQQPFLELQQLPTMDHVIDQLLLAATTATDITTAATTGEEGSCAPGAGRRGRGRRVAGAAAKRPALVKVGEGSYGEAWRLGDSGGGRGRRGGGGGGSGCGVASSVVMKVVPIDGDMIFNGGPQRSASEVMSEAVMGRALSGLREGPTPGAVAAAAAAGAGAGNWDGAAGPPTDPSGSGGSAILPANWTAGFVHMRALAVCRGPYSRELVNSWKKWDEQYGSENEPVSRLPRDQLYWVSAMEDSGTDLEKYDLLSWEQLRSVLLQVAVSLAVAEAELSFEHRDLHWGNVLVQPAGGRPDYCGPGGWLAARLRGRNLRVASCGVATTIIDFTNSRLEARDGLLVFCDLSRDPAVFEGTKGDVQFDTYRCMRDFVEDDWSSSCPATNCLWLAYLADVLCKKFGGGGGGGGPKGGKGFRLTAGQKRQLQEFRKRAVQYNSCGDIMWDELFKGQLQTDDD